MDDMEKYLEKRMKRDNEFKQIWEEEAVKREIVKRIIDMRLKEGLSQKDLAQKLSTSQSSIARFESGKGNPTLAFLMKLGKAFNKKLELRFI